MRIVIEGIDGEDLFVLMRILQGLEFENKSELISKWLSYKSEIIQRVK